MDLDFLRSFREKNLITVEGNYEKDYIFKVPNVNKRVCYVNYRDGPNWMWMYDILISKFSVQIVTPS